MKYNDINILIPISKFNGCITSLYDLYINLKNNGVDCNIQIIIDNPKIIPFINKYIDIFGKCSIINKNDVVCSTILITSIDLFSLHTGIENRLNYKKLLIIDSASIFRNKENKDFFNRLNALSDVLFLGNNYNSNFGLKNYTEYYHKFSNRLDMISHSNLYHDLSTETLKYKNKSIRDMCPFYYSKFIYRRWFKEHGMYFENIGKMIFEFLYLGKVVYYKGDNKCMDDGLSDYLRLFDIDDNYNQVLGISKDEIKNKLFFHEDDFILRYIKGVV